MQVLLTMVLAAVLSVMLAREARADEVELGAEDTLGAEEDLLPGPVELGRYRTSRESNLYLAIPIGQGRLCLIDPEAYAATKGSWTGDEHDMCVIIATGAGAFVVPTLVHYATGGVSVVVNGALVFAGGTFGAVMGIALCPGPNTPSPARSIGGFLGNAFGNLGLPCGSPSAGSGCGHGASCACEGSGCGP